MDCEKTPQPKKAGEEAKPAELAVNSNAVTVYSARYKPRTARDLNENPRRSEVRWSESVDFAEEKRSYHIKLDDTGDIKFEETQVQEVDTSQQEGGYGWVIVFCGFVTNMLVLGYHYSFGVILSELLDEFDEGRGTTAWIVAILTAATFLSCPVASALMTVYGPQVVVIGGSLLSAVGIVCSAFAPNIWIMYITVGLMTGVGMGMIYLPGVVIVGYYFDKKRALANGIATSGTGVGTLAFPPLMSWLIENYGWRQGSFILAGIVLQGVLAGLLMRPKEEPAPAKMETTDLNLKLERIEPRQRIQSVISRRSMFRRQSNVSFRDAMERHRRKSSVHIDAAQMLHELQQEEIGEEEPTLRGQLCKLRESMWSMSLVKDGIFMAFFFSAGIWGGAYYNIFTFLPDRAIQNNISSANAAFLISLAGIGNTTGRLIFGLLCDLENIREKRSHIYGGSILVCAFSTIISSFITSYTSFVIYSLIFGIGLGVSVVLQAVVLTDLLGVDQLAVAYGMVLAAEGVACLMAPAMAGWVYDLTHSYAVVFGGAGAVLALSGLILGLIPLIQWRHRIAEQTSTPEKLEDRVISNRPLRKKSASV